MTDRKSLDELFDFPTGRDAGAARRGDSHQGDSHQGDSRPGDAPRGGSQPGLFDGEVGPESPDSGGPAGAGRHPQEQEAAETLLFDESPEVGAGPPPVKSPEPRRAGVGDRLLAGVADLVFHVTFLCVAALSMLPLGLEPEPDRGPGLLLLLLCFSFLYVSLPLAFWGQTPGMAWQGLRARDLEGLPLSFGQTALRWIWSVVTVALAGLPLVVAFSGRSLVDRMSGSVTLEDRRH